MRLSFFVLAFALAVLSPALADARWFEARSPNFVVYSDGGEEGLRKSIVLLEDYDRLLRTLTGTTAAPSPAPLLIYLVSSNEKLREVSNVPPGVLGFYQARVGGTAAFAIRGDRLGTDGQEVLLHEYAHHFATRYYPAYYPAWYAEGFAEYVMTARFADDRIEVGRYNPGRAATLLRGIWLPVDRIFSSGAGRLSREEMAQFYAESWLIVHYLLTDHERRDKLKRYLAELNRGTAESAAFQMAFGIDHRAFEQDLKRYMGGGIAYSSIGRAPAQAATVSVRALPESADALLLPYAALTLGTPEPAREEATIAAIRKAAARYPDDPFAMRVLARANINSGDRAAGVATLDHLIEAAPKDAELLYLRGVGDFYSGRKNEAERDRYFAAARPWFARAVAADPSYYTALYRLAQTAPHWDDGISDETLAQLVTAHELAPLVGDIAVDTAIALSAYGRTAEAEKALIPIATNPHGGNVDRARRLLDQLRAANGEAARPEPPVQPGT